MSQDTLEELLAKEEARLFQQGLSKALIEEINQRDGSLFTYHHKVGSNRKGGTGRRYATPYLQR